VARHFSWGEDLLAHESDARDLMSDSAARAQSKPVLGHHNWNETPPGVTPPFLHLLAADALQRVRRSYTGYDAGVW